MTKRQRLQLPEKLDIETLPSQPAIIKSVLHVVKTHCPNAEDVLEAAGREWTPETTIILDVSTNSRSANVNEEKANQIKNFIFDNPQDVSVCVNIARALNINRSAVYGLTRVGNPTPAHEHTPLGVINLLLGVGCKKEWHFWQPGQHEDEKKPHAKITQESGDLLWFPPSWTHEVLTIGGQVCNGQVIAPCWVSWCLPRKYALRGFADMASKESKEEQMKGVLSLNRIKKVYSLIIEYIDN